MVLSPSALSPGFLMFPDVSCLLCLLPCLVHVLASPMKRKRKVRRNQLPAIFKRLHTQFQGWLPGWRTPVLKRFSFSCRPGLSTTDKELVELIHVPFQDTDVLPFTNKSKQIQGQKFTIYEKHILSISRSLLYIYIYSNYIHIYILYYHYIYIYYYHYIYVYLFNRHI